MIKAGSLYYSIIICVLVGICCMCFLMLSSYTKIHATILATQNELLENNKSAINLFLGKVNELTLEQEQDIFETGIVSSAQSYNWGFYKVLRVSTTFKNDTVEKFSLLGVKNNDSTALYLTDQDKPLQMVGNAKIYGDAFLPQKGIKKGYLNDSRAFNSFTFLEGAKKRSGKKLPNKVSSFYIKDSLQQVKLVDELNNNQLLYNNFKNATIKIKVNRSSVNNKKLAGNIILEATDSLYIRKGNDFNNILIKAPIVIFEKGFKGIVQVIATEEVVLEEKVVLNYPSGIYINNDDALLQKVELNNSAKLLGSIVITGNNSLGTMGRQLLVNKNALIVGSAYCFGSTQLKGKIIGSLYTDSFYLKTEAASYENYIQEGVIDRRSLPNYFLGAYMGNDEYGVQYDVIKEL